eukprot:scaffold1717_cov169-Amphora_coffeaeformis.AAC.5
MGKKPRGAALRSKKRQQEAIEELQERQAEQIAASSVVDKPDEQLFILDTEGAIVPHHERPPKPETLKKKRAIKVLTVKEKIAVERLLKKHSRQELVRMVKEGKALLDQTHVRTHGARADKTKKANYDLWGAGNDDDKQQATTNSSQKAGPKLGSAPAGVAPGHVQRKARKAPPPRNKNAVAVEVAQSGQSYRPDPDLHKHALEKAKEVEARRLKAEEYKNTPISQGMSEETKALILGDTDSEDESTTGNNSDDDEAEEGATTTTRKRREKLTRAQRNKQKRLRVEKAIQDKQRKRRKLENSVAQIPRFKKELNREIRELEQRKKEIAEAKEKDQRVKGSKVFEAVSESNPIEAPTYPIGLSSEVKKATLRTIKPKGSLVTDRMMSLRDRDLAAAVTGHKKKQKKRRKAVKGKHNAGIEGDDFAVLG